MARTPPPPGFVGSSLRRAGGTYSAPPPPGFATAADQRDHVGGVGLAGSGGGDGAGGAAAAALQTTAAPGGDPSAARPPPPPRAPPQARHHHPGLLITGAAVTGAGAVPTTWDDHEDHQTRTTSFANLAEALGEGLAESMESSLERQRSDRLQQQIGLAQGASALTINSRQEAGGSSLFAISGSPALSERALTGASGILSQHQQGRRTATPRLGELPQQHQAAPRYEYSSAGAGVAVTVSAAGAAAADVSLLAKDVAGLTPSTVAESVAPSPSAFSLHSSPPLSLYGHGMGVAVEGPRSGTASPGAGAAAALKGLTLSGHGEAATTTASTSHAPDHLPPSGSHHGGGGVGGGGFPGSSQGMRADAAAYDAHHHGGGPDPTPQQQQPRSDPHRHHGGRSVPLALEADAAPYQPRDDASGLASAIRAANALREASESELAPFVWEVPPPGGGGGSSSSSSADQRTGRGLAILGASRLHDVHDVRSTCEAFGGLLSFRHEFRRSRGVIFLSYHDLRSARHSALELAGCLEKLAAAGGSEGAGAGAVRVVYCTALNSSSPSDESTILLGNLPRGVEREGLTQTMTSYGAVRSVAAAGGSSFAVEFHDIQDARQALLELESSQQWGPDATMTVGTRHPAERKRGQDLLALLGGWRHGEGASPSSSAEPRGSGHGHSPAINPVSVGAPSPSTSSDSTSPMPHAADTSFPLGASASNPNGIPASEGPAAAAADAPPPPPPGAPPPPMQQPHPAATQLMIGPDGQMTYVVVNPAAMTVPHQPQHHVQHPHPHAMAHMAAHAAPYIQQQIVHGPHGTYVTSIPASAPPPQVHHHPGQPPVPPQPQYILQHHNPAAVHHHPHHAVPPPQYHHHLPPGTVLAPPPPVAYAVGPHGAAPMPMPIYAHQPYVLHAHPAAVPGPGPAGVGGGPHGHGNGGGGNGTANGHSGRGQHHRSGGNGGGTEESFQLLLNIDDVRSGADPRTSLMVRNIPNKYTQQMLLSEFAEGGHGTDKIDFFYLPIDFKNRCNRGYAFVNFVDAPDIVPFHERYNGRRWRVFNSDKICDITYARIQGKAAMTKRFQNSALMEKDDEYKPLVFASRGPDKGKREDFPVAEQAQQGRSSGVSSLSGAAAKNMHSPPR